MQNKTYLFDFDGTLVDSMPTFTAVMLKILNENNIKYDENNPQEFFEDGQTYEKNDIMWY